MSPRCSPPLPSTRASQNAAPTLNQDRILADLRRQLAGIEKAEFAVLMPPPISGLGQSGGFQMMVEDRRSLGLTELEETTMELIRAARAQSSLRGRHHHL